MALIRCEFFSEALGLSSSMTVILPQKTRRQIGLTGRARTGGAPVLYLLHGLSDDHSTWLRRTSIERYAAPLGLAVVMPAVGRSFYCDMARGGRYWTFLSEELPGIVRALFPVSTRRADTFAAGLSMGGYGALKLALRHPERFAAAASLSGALDATALIRHLGPEMRPELENTFGDLRRIRGSENDLFALADRNRRKRLPRLFLACGEEDFLFPDNLRFRDHLRALRIPHEWRQEPGTHEWGYWDAQIQAVLNWLPLGRR